MADDQNVKVGTIGRASRRVGSFIASLILTFLGLTAITFLISRLTKIDPVLAVVGDKAENALAIFGNHML